MKAHFTIQCEDPETGRQGCWVFKGEDYRMAGCKLSPAFCDVVDLFLWMEANGWEMTGGLTCERREATSENDCQ
jgi:hypothetical protein